MNQEENPGRHEVDRSYIAATMADLRQTMQMRIESGLVPYNGLWLTPSDAHGELLKERKRAWVHALELLVLFVFNTFACLLIIALVWALCY